MRRVVVDSILSLDGYFAGPKNEVDWFLFDEESLDWSREILRSAGTILFGRVTCEEMAAYWPTAKDKEPFISNKLTELPKIVFSRTLKKAEWNNSSVVSRSPQEVVAKLNQNPGSDIVVLGSSSIVLPLVKDGLVDEYRIRIQPIILGQGRPLLIDKSARHPLKLVGAKSFKSGVVALTYTPRGRPVTGEIEQ